MQKNINAIWKNTCNLLSENLSADVYERWISVIQPKSIDDNQLVLKVANDFYHDWLKENYLSLIQDAVASVIGHQVEITFEIDNQPVLGPEKLNRKTSVKTKNSRLFKRRKPSGLNSKYTFDKFVVGSSNNFAHAASLAVARAPARAYNPLFIYGGVGLGKTHLMQAIGNHALVETNAKICYISSETFTNEYIDALQRRSLVQFRNNYRNADLLLIDDIQFLSGKERLQEEFFHTFNALFDNHRQIVLTCDSPAAEIPGLEQRLVSRFEWGLVTELEAPDVETRTAILRHKEEALKVSLSAEVINFIAENICSNIRRLEGALIRVSSYASLTGKEMDVETVEKLLQDTLDQENNQPILSLETIQRTVAEHYDIRYTDIISKRKPAAIAFPRQVAMYLCRNMTSHSLPTIGEAFGKNHATVLYACKTLEKKIQNDSTVRQAVNGIRKRLSGSN